MCDYVSATHGPCHTKPHGHKTRCAKHATSKSAQECTRCSKLYHPRGGTIPMCGRCFGATYHQRVTYGGAGLAKARDDLAGPRLLPAQC